MTNKRFGGILSFFVVVGAVVGTAVAWMNTEVSALNTIEVGNVDFGMDYGQFPNAILGPDGSETGVGVGWVWNTGDLNLIYDSGGVQIVNVDIPLNGVPQDQGICAPSNFGGSVAPLGTLLPPIEISGGGPAIGTAGNGHFGVLMSVAAGAPSGCQGALVDYVVFITMQAVEG